MRKRHPVRCQVGTRKASASEPLLTCRKVLVGIETGDRTESPGSAWRVPEYWPGGVWHVGGASLVCGSCAERGKAAADTARPQRRAGERERVGAACPSLDRRRHPAARHSFADRGRGRPCVPHAEASSQQPVNRRPAARYAFMRRGRPHMSLVARCWPPGRRRRAPTPRNVKNRSYGRVLAGHRLDVL
jgi:hypothetical protein